MCVCRRSADTPLLADGHLLRLESFISSSLQHELYELDQSKEGAKRVEDLLCRVRELCEMSGVSSARSRSATCSSHWAC